MSRFLPVYRDFHRKEVVVTEDAVVGRVSATHTFLGYAKFPKGNCKPFGQTGRKNEPLLAAE